MKNFLAGKKKEKTIRIYTGCEKTAEADKRAGLKRGISVLLTALMIISSALLPGCSMSAGEMIFGPSADDEKIEYEYRDEAYIPMERVRTLNPIISKDEDTYNISRLVYDSLFELDEHLTPVPSLVQSYTFDSEKATLSISLNPDIRWSDGERLTASDVKFTVEALQSQGAATLYNEYVAPVASVKLDKASDTSCVIQFRSSSDMSIANLVFPIIPEHQYKNQKTMRAAGNDFIPVGTGPYSVSEYKPLSHVILTGNTYYRGDVPKNTITFVVLPDKASAVNLIDVNNISVTYERALDRDTLIADNPDAKTVSCPANRVEFLGFNTRKDNLKLKRFRRAVAYACDTEKMLETAYFKSGILADSLYFPGYLGSENKGSLYPYSTKKAEALLRDLKFSDADNDGWLENSKGDPINIEILVNDNNQSRVSAAQLLKTALDKIKIRSQVIAVPEGEYNSRLASANFDIYIGGYTFNERYNLKNMYYTGMNLPGYSNPEVDEYLTKLQSGLTVEEMLSVYSDMKKVLSKDIPYYCLVYTTYGLMISPELEGEQKPQFNNFYKGCETWKSRYAVQKNDENEGYGADNASENSGGENAD
ncbi:MAG: hypothetical protein K6F52_05970 [Clostridia bacterium]|nr:hypothetical protein [Clostridia bacterium]